MTKAYERYAEAELTRPMVRFDLSASDVRALGGDFDQVWMDAGRLARRVSIARLNRRWVREWGPLLTRFYRALGGS